MTETLIRRKRTPFIVNDTVSIYIRNYAKKTMVVKVSPKVKVETIRQSIKQKMKIPEEDQALFLNGHLVLDEAQEIQVQNRYIFHLVNLKRVGLQRISILVKRIQKQSPTYKYTVKSNMKISDFIRDLLSLDYPDSQNYFLVYTGRQMMGCNTFEIQYVQNNSEIICVHKIEDRKNAGIQVRRPSQNEMNNHFTMLKKRQSEENQMKVEEEQRLLKNQENQKITEESQEPNQEKQAIVCIPETQPQKQEQLQPATIPALDTEGLKDEEQKLQESQKPISQPQQQLNQKQQEDDPDYQEIEITNKQQYSIISKNKPSKENSHARKRTKPRFAAPEPLREEDQQDKKQDVSSNNLRENTHLGLTVISSRHDEEESIEPNELDYKNMLAKDDEKQSSGIVRTRSQPLKFLESGLECADHKNYTDDIEIVPETPIEEQKQSNLSKNEIESNQIVVIQDSEVCEGHKESSQPQMNYQSFARSKENLQNNQYSLVEEKSDDKLRVVEIQQGFCQQIISGNGQQNMFDANVKTQKSQEYMEIMGIRARTRPLEKIQNNLNKERKQSQEVIQRTCKSQQFVNIMKMRLQNSSKKPITLLNLSSKQTVNSPLVPRTSNSQQFVDIMTVRANLTQKILHHQPNDGFIVSRTSKSQQFIDIMTYRANTKLQSIKQKPFNFDLTKNKTERSQQFIDIMVCRVNILPYMNTPKVDSPLTNPPQINSPEMDSPQTNSPKMNSPKFIIDLGENKQYEIKDLEVTAKAGKKIINVFNPHLSQDKDGQNSERTEQAVDNDV